jgi:hypothetical protein
MSDKISSTLPAPAILICAQEECSIKDNLIFTDIDSFVRFPDGVIVHLHCYLDKIKKKISAESATS